VRVVVDPINAAIAVVELRDPCCERCTSKWRLILFAYRRAIGRTA
jgi:hypothetical protein